MKKIVSIKPTKRKLKNPKPLTTEEIRIAFIDGLRKRFYTENELATLLPKLIKKATLYELGLAISAHLAITEKQILRLIHILDSIEERAIPSKCPVFSAFADECHAIINTNDFGCDTDVSILKACRKIMALEMTSFSTLRSYAATLEEKSAADLLATAIKEEKKAHTLYAEIELPEIYKEDLGQLA